MSPWRAAVAAAWLLVAACETERVPELRFEALDPTLDDEAAVRVEGRPSEARALVMEATATRDVAPTWLAVEPWHAVAVVPRDGSLEGAIARGRTFVHLGGALHLDVRLGAGDRGAFMGGIAETGAERAMVQVKLEDRQTLGARFRVRLHRVRREGRAEDVTPPYLAAPLPRGTYRAWVDVPPEGARFVVEVETTVPSGEVVGRAWASPVAVERPWLAR